MSLLEPPPIPEEIFAAFRFLQHCYFLVCAFRYVVTRAERLTLCLLAASAANAILVVRPDRRSLRTGRRYTTYLLLSWTGHSYETAFCLFDILQHLTLHGRLVLGPLTLVLLFYIFRKPVHRFMLRRIPRTSLLESINRIAQILWYTPRLWHALRTCGPLLSSFYLAGAVTLAIMPIALYLPLCALQDSISAWRVRRALGPDGNARSAGATLPAEVQLLIFHLLQTRGRFGADEHLARDTPFDHDADLIPFSGARDLAAAARVCAAWRAAATEALYHDAVLRSGARTYRFSQALALRPALALLVRRIVLPEWVQYAPVAESADAPLSTLSTAIEHIMSCCVNATEIRLFRDATPALADIPGLRAAGSRVSHLHIQSGIPQPWAPPGTIHEPEDVDMRLLLSFIPRLESLTLTRQRVLFENAALDNTQRRALCGIHTLSLGACTLDMQHLIRLLHQLPNLRVAELRDTSFSDTHGLVSVADLFATQLRTLVDLSLRVHPKEKCRITFRSFGLFSALRTLTVNAHMLPAIVTLPPNLETLIVSFAPYTCHARSRYFVRPDCTRSLLSAVSAVRALVPEAPTLRSVQLWDDVHLEQLAPWSVASFMLREMLAHAGIAVDVNLFIELGGNLRLKDEFSMRQAMRRIFWQGVL